MPAFPPAILHDLLHRYATASLASSPCYALSCREPPPHSRGAVTATSARMPACLPAWLPLWPPSAFLVAVRACLRVSFRSRRNIIGKGKQKKQILMVTSLVCSFGTSGNVLVVRPSNSNARCSAGDRYRPCETKTGQIHLFKIQESQTNAEIGNYRFFHADLLSTRGLYERDLGRGSFEAQGRHLGRP